MNDIKENDRALEIYNELVTSKNTQDFNNKLVKLNLERLRLRRTDKIFKLECLNKFNKHMVVYRSEKLRDMVAYISKHGDNVLMFF